MQFDKGIVFFREKFESLYTEMLPLAHAHYREIAWLQDKISLDVDEEKYLILADAGKLLCYSARHGKRLIGYCLFVVDNGLHYQQTKMALNDVLYLDPNYRLGGIGAAFISYCEKDLQVLGVQVVTLHVKPKLDFGSLCERLGYEMGDRIWHKWLGD